MNSKTTNAEPELHEAASSGFRPSRNFIIFCAWAFTAILLLYKHWQDIVRVNLVDPDDSMRMAQVRDLLSGQGWWDLFQYRVNPSDGGVLMHWSRIVDAPLAGGIALLRPFVGQPLAEQIVMASWPLILLLLLFAALSAACRSFPDRRMAYVMPLMLMVVGSVLPQFRPMRVDHHSWQALLAVVILWQALRPPTRWSGMFAGLAGAAYLAISIEGLPIAAIFVGLAALRWALYARAHDRDYLFGIMGGLALGSILFQFATRGPASLFDSWCDALSAPYLGALAVAFAGVAATLALAPRSPVVRFGLLGVAAVLAGGTLLLIDPQCSGGPFVQLDPLVVDYWYIQVAEGQPLWHANVDEITLIAVPMLMGLISTALAWRYAKTDMEKRQWTTVFVALAGAIFVAAFVLRSCVTAHIFALFGSTWLTLAAWTRARAFMSPLPRVFASVSVALTIPVIASVVALWFVHLAVPSTKVESDRLKNVALRTSVACLDKPAVRALNALPVETALIPLDMGGPMMFLTHHRLVATGHHRNDKAMTDTIAAFISTPDEAKPHILKRQATLIVLCPAEADFTYYRKSNKNSLAQRLFENRPPDWLERLPTPGAKGLQVWRVKPGV